MAVVKVTPAIAKQAIADIDWAEQDALTDDQIERRIEADPDASPVMTDAETVAALARDVRVRLGLSQAAFAARYSIPVGTLRDWEQGRKGPDRTALAYLRVIAKEPEMVAAALAGAA